MLWRLALSSMRSRGLTVVLTALAIALSVALVLGVEKLRLGAKISFADTISDTDLIMGARTGGVQLLLYAVFRIGAVPNTISWDSYQQIAARPDVNWIVPISLGDSHRQFRVLGTTPAFFDRYKYRSGRDLTLRDGAVMSDLFEAVIGADVAETLGYQIGDPIVVAHGVASFVQHEDTPFRITGILDKTGTPVDRTVIVGLEAIEAIHVDWQDGAQRPGTPTPPETLRQMELQPKAITAALIGAQSRLQIFTLQRAINEYPSEPLMAIIPGVALQELWGIIGIAETALLAVSVIVVVTALLGMAAMMLAGLSARRREMAILRALGAGPGTIMGLLLAEALLIAAIGAALGIGLLYAGLVVAQPWLDVAYGIFVPISGLTPRDLLTVLAVLVAAALVCLIPAWRAFRISLADGMSVRN